MNTFQLTCFLTVAETLSFAKAAKQPVPQARQSAPQHSGVNREEQQQPRAQNTPAQIVQHAILQQNAARYKTTSTSQRRQLIIKALPF